MQLGVSVTGTRSIAHGLNSMGERVTDLRPAWGEIADDFLDVERDVFATQGASLGRRWKPNAPWWAAYKQEHYGADAGVLVQNPDTARLKRSVTVKDAPYSLRDVRPAQLRIGTSLGIAAIHQKGGTLTHKRGDKTVSVRIPARPFVRPRQQAHRWVGIVDDFVLTGRVRSDRTIGL
jgi:phage gpG-like protein